jgi:hypothetical protein
MKTRELFNDLLAGLTASYEPQTAYGPYAKLCDMVLSDPPAKATNVTIVERLNWPAPGYSRQNSLYRAARSLRSMGLRVTLQREVLSPTVPKERLKRTLALPGAYGVVGEAAMSEKRRYPLDNSGEVFDGPGVPQARHDYEKATEAHRCFLQDLWDEKGESVPGFQIEVDFVARCFEPQVIVIFSSEGVLEGRLVRGFYGSRPDFEEIGSLGGLPLEIRATNETRSASAPLLNRDLCWRQAFNSHLWEVESRLERLTCFDRIPPESEGCGWMWF